MQNLLKLLHNYTTQQELIDEEPEIIFEHSTWVDIVTEVIKLKERDIMLTFYEEEGVDNWSGYDDVQSRYLNWLDMAT